MRAQVRDLTLGVLLAIAIFALSPWASGASVTLSNGASCTASAVVIICDGASTPPTPPTPQPPTPPVQPPPSTCSGPGDISDTAPHVYTFYSGQAQTVCFRTSGGYAQMFGFSVSGSSASSVTYAGTNIPQTTFKPSGSDFRFNPVSGFVGVGVIAVTVTMNNVNGGAASFGVQATGSVGP